MAIVLALVEVNICSKYSVMPGLKFTFEIHLSKKIMSIDDCLFSQSFIIQHLAITK